MNIIWHMGSMNLSFIQNDVRKTWSEVNRISFLLFVQHVTTRYLRHGEWTCKGVLSQNTKGWRLKWLIVPKLFRRKHKEQIGKEFLFSFKCNLRRALTTRNSACTHDWYTWLKGFQYQKRRTERFGGKYQLIRNYRFIVVKTGSIFIVLLGVL